jgi:hypothetical protein
LSNGKTPSSIKKLGKYASETFQMMKQVHSEEALGHSAMFKWHKHFAQGRDSLEDDKQTGQLRMVRTELQIQEVAMLWCLPTTPKRQKKSQQQQRISLPITFQKILSDNLNMSRVAESFI